MIEPANLAPGIQYRDRLTHTPSVLALWHLLSLDAPCVAAVWTLFIARVFRVALPWTAPAALSLAVWMLYVADRLADAAAGKAFEERHHFHRRGSAAFTAAWMAGVPVLLWLVMHLPHALRDGWLLLAVPLAAYVGAVHTLQLRHVPKEPLIAVFFGMAVAMPVISSGVLSEGLAAACGLFALLCWLNCAAIATWESPPGGYIDPLTRLLGRHFAASATVAVLLSICVGLRPAPSRPVAVGVAASLCLLLLLERERTRFSRTHVRSLTDAALLTPLVLLPLLAWWWL